MESVFEKYRVDITSKEKILSIQRKLKQKQIEISELTDKELSEMIELYKIQIENKKSKLKVYRDKFFRNKKENIEK